MVKASKVCIIMVLLCSGLFSLAAQAIQTEGFGASEEKAKLEALRDLSAYFELKVKSVVSASSQFTMVQGVTVAKDLIVADVRTSSEVPLLGAEVQVMPWNSAAYPYKATASMDLKTSGKLYTSKLESLAKEISAGKKLADATKSDATKSKDEEELRLLEVLADIEAFYTYRNILTLLGGSAPALPVDKASIKDRIRQIESVADTLDRAAKKLAMGMTQKNIYLYAPLAKGSSEITPFAATLRETMRGKLATVDNPETASYIMKGSYDKVGNNLEVSYRLVGRQGAEQDVVLGSTSARLAPEAFRDYKHEASTIDLENLSREGLVITTDFRVDVTTNHGKSDLLFYEKDRLKLLVKLNAPGYLYVIEHIAMPKGSFSNILPIFTPDSGEKRQFVRYVGGDEVNKWLSLGEFEVAAPFGIERLQFVASSQDLIDKLPPYKYDGTYFALTGSLGENIMRTRGLIPTQTPAVRAAETVFTFTTMTR